MKGNRRGICAAVCALAFGPWSQFTAAQSANAPSAPPPVASRLLTTLPSLSSDEKVQGDLAGREFAAGKYADALVIYKALLATHPQELVVAKLAAESEINTGEAKSALAHLQPIEASHPDDWQACALLARAYAETGDATHRDAEIARMADLHKRGVVPQRIDRYFLEKIHTNNKVVMIWHSLEPWGRYRVYDYARVYNSDGQLLSQLTLESSDFDQNLFAQQQPNEAAKGVRLFSIDGYSDGPVTANGQHTESHSTYDMVAGEPSYETVREAFIDIAAGKPHHLDTSILFKKTQ